MRGADLRRFWSNPVLQQWVIENIQLDEKEQDDKLRLQILAANPKLYQELTKEQADLKTIEQHVDERLQTIKQADDDVLQSLEKFKKMQQRDEDDFSLKDEDIDAASQSEIS